MLDKIFEKTEQSINRLKQMIMDAEVSSENIKEKYSSELTLLKVVMEGDIALFRIQLHQIMTEELDHFNKEVKILEEEKVSELKVIIEEHYLKCLAESSERAQQTFDKNMIQIFEDYSDDFTPRIFKSLLGYIFRFGRKKNK